MLFNSAAYAVFFAVVTGSYFLLPHRLRWALLLTASCTGTQSAVPVLQGRPDWPLMPHCWVHCQPVQSSMMLTACPLKNQSASAVRVETPLTSTCQNSLKTRQGVADSPGAPSQGSVSQELTCAP